MELGICLSQLIIYHCCLARIIFLSAHYVLIPSGTKFELQLLCIMTST